MTITHPFRAVARRVTVRVLLAAFAAFVLMLIDRGAGHPIVHASPTTIADENLKPGADDWDVSGAGSPDIQGFATDISVNIGETVHFKISATGGTPQYGIRIYRLGYYGGLGATLVDDVVPASIAAQPACLTEVATGLVDCGNWSESASWMVPSTAVSGIYIAKLERTDSGHVGNSSHIVFVVRDDSRTADIVFQTSDTTWQAYNQYPGPTAATGSLYCGGPLSNQGSAYLRSCETRSAKVSYNRPFDTRRHDPQSFLFNGEYPMVRWLEANGYDVKYQSGVDTDRRGFDLTGIHKPKAFLSVGHDEYWSGHQRAIVEGARNAGVNLAFFSGNEMYWKTRYEASIDGTGTAYRTLVSYKETIANAKIDPAVDPTTGVPIWTGTWRDPRFASESDGGHPENGLIGQIFTVNCCSDRIKIPQAMGGMRLWANTGVSEAPAGDFYKTPQETLGYEWDEDLDNGSRPAGLIHLSSTTLVVPEKLSDFGANVAQGTATHSLTLYRAGSGALVFGAGTVQWSWGLDGTHDRGDTVAAHTPDQAMQQATVNLFADMDVQPATLTVGADPQRPLVQASKTTDQQAPTTSVVFPTAGAEVPSGSRLTITGTATEVGGGVVSGVEVSLDNGSTWHVAQGTAVWNYDWTPGTPGGATIKVRAIDDSGNLGFPTSVNVIVVQGDCPCSNLWKPTTVPPLSDTGDSTPLELGVKFKSDSAGFITGIRYYKSVANNGTHVGHLWTSSGTQLAEVTFVNETQSGWQEALFNSPVPITADTTYIASYHTNVGHYAATNDYFTSASVDSPPLHAPTSLIAAGNGVFAVGESAFPTQTFRDTNYWVDFAFSTTSSDTTPPTISNLRDTTIDSSKVTISWTTNEPATSKVEYSTDFTFPQAQTLTVNDSAFVSTRTLLIAGLRPNTTYYYRVTSTDAAGNSATSAAPSFTVPGPTLRDTAQSDFLAGTGAGTYASETQDGELILAPTVGTEFSGTTMPQGWTEFAWDPSGYSALGGGKLIVDGVRVAMCVTDNNGDCVAGETQTTTPSAIYGPGHSVEFVATFTGDPFQHAGLGQTLGLVTEPWAIFSTMGGGALNARSNNGTASIETFLGSGFVGSAHHFRIDWTKDPIDSTKDRFDYWIDGSLVASHTITVAGLMRPIAASDFNPFGGNVTVNWMRMSPYGASGVFESRVFDAEAPVDWHSIQWTANTPAGTGLAISIRTGNTATPDGTWTAWTPVASSGPLSLNSQFIQYRAELSTSSTDVSPQLEDIIISTGHAPVANPDSAIVPENGSHVFQPTGSTSLTANDTDADAGDILRVVAVTQPAHGIALLNADGSVTYTPTATYFGPDAFTYTVSDGLLTSSAVVSIDVRFGNIPPVAQNDFYNINEDTVLSVPAAIGVLANDSDTENDPLSTVLVTVPQHGSLALSSDGSFTYTPNPNYAGPDAFQYKAFDGADQSNAATVSIAVAQVNDPPITEADAYTAVLNQPLDVAAPGVLRNDHDVEVEDTAPLHAVLVTGPGHGQLTLNADGSFSYVPNAEYLGIDTFTYRAVDHLNAAGNVNTVTLTTAIKAIAGTVQSGGTLAIGNGVVDPSDPLHSSVTSPSAATVTIAQGVIAASQAPTGYTFLNQQINIAITGADGAEIVASPTSPIVLSFAVDHSLIPAGQDYSTFQMFRNGILIPNCLGATTIPSANLDPCITSRSAAGDGDVLLTILTTHASRWNMGLSSDGVGTAPVAMNDGVYNLDFGQQLSVQAPGVLGNDVARSAITAHLIDPPPAGTVTLAESGAFLFTPASGQCGAVTFTYVANDGTGDSSPATASLLIDCLPHANDDAVTVLEDSGVTAITVLSNDNDPDPGQTLTVTGTGPASNGTVAVLSGGMGVTYRPNANFYGSDSFTYTITDGRGGSATATVSVTVSPVNDAPSFTGGANQTALEDAGPQTVLNWATAISAGPANESGQALSFTVTTTNAALFSAQPAVSPNGTLTYTSAPDANGSATVSVVLHDDGGTANGGVDASAAQSFTIGVTAVNDAPVAANGSLSTNEDTAASGTLSASDVDGDALTYSIVANGAKGTATITNAATGAYTYTPNPNANGSDSITFRASDGTVNSNTATVSISIAAVNDAPVAANGSLSTDEDTAANGTLSASDVDGDALTYSIVTNGAKGTATITNAATGAYTYTPNPNANGSDSITFRVSDGTVNSNTATVSISIAPVNDAPTAANGSLSTTEDAAASGTLSASDVDGDALTYTLVANGAKGQAVITNAATGAFTYTPNPNANGGDTFTFRASDGSLFSNIATVTVTIAAVNDAPSFTKGADQTVLEDAGAQTIAGWATSISAGPTADESGQAVNFIVSNSNNALFSAQPAIAANGTLSFTPAANTNGSATVTVQLHDDGGVANGGADTSAAQTFTINLTAVNDAPSFTKGADQSAVQDTGAHTVTGWATAISAGPSDESAQTLNFIVSNSNNALFSAQPAVSSTGTLTYTPAAGATGSATVTVSLHDSGGTANGGVDTSAAQTFTITINPRPGLSISDASVLEGNSGFTPMPFTVTLSPASTDTVTVDWTTAAGTALSPKDFTAASGTLTFAPGETSKTITVQIVGDTTKEKNETMGVRLSNAVNALLADSSGLGTILDDDSTPRLQTTMVSATTSNSTTTLSSSSTSLSTLSTDTATTGTGTTTTTATSPAASVIEGNSGRTFLTFAVTPSNATDETMTVDFATIAGPAARPNVDFIVKSGTLVFAPETTDPQFITVEVVANTRHQPTHPFFVRLANPIAAVIDALDTEADILDDDPIPSISVSDVTVGESAIGSVNAVLNVTLSNDTDDTVTVNYTTVAGSALDGIDYTGQSGTMTFTPGVTSHTITVPINPDTSWAEGLEGFYLDITAPANATILKGRGTVTITPPTAWVNSTTADFAAGTFGTGAYLSETANGEVTLAPTVGTEFSGTALPVGWTNTVLAAGGTTVVANGGLTVEGTSVLAPTTFGPGRTLEFVATFGGGNNQNVGLGLTTALIPPFAMFGTKTDGQFYARSVAPGQAFETPIAGNWFGTPHRFRIDYGTTTVTYWIDNVQKAVHTITYPAKSSSLRPAATDLTIDGKTVKVDWMRMSAYAASGVYTSKVYDAGAAVAWTTASWLADMPATGGNVVVEVRTGNTATPDATWTAFSPIASGGTIPAAAARYAQYKVTLTTTVPSTAPAVKEVILSFAK
jgi:VCBS repeat-containing protein